MSPKRAPITKFRRATHVLASPGYALCGSKVLEKPYFSQPGLRPLPDCKRCLAAYEKARRLESAIRCEISARTEARARHAYQTWAHLAVRGVPEAFELLTPEERYGWIAVVKYFEGELSCLTSR